MTDLDARIWQAVIAGGFIGLGWFVNGWLNRRAAADLRREKMRDMHRALYAEIGVYLANIGDDETLSSYADSVLDRMAKDNEFVPLIPREHGDAVFLALIQDIHLLPRQTIDPIVAYYSQVAAIAAMADDMRGQAFKGLTQDRRQDMYRDYIEMKRQALQFGRFANMMINAFGEGGAELADATARGTVSSRASDPSDRSQE